MLAASTSGSGGDTATGGGGGGDLMSAHPTSILRLEHLHVVWQPGASG